MFAPTERTLELCKKESFVFSWKSLGVPVRVVDGTPISPCSVHGQFSELHPDNKPPAEFVERMETRDHVDGATQWGEASFCFAHEDKI